MPRPMPRGRAAMAGLLRAVTLSAVTMSCASPPPVPPVAPLPPRAVPQAVTLQGRVGEVGAATRRRDLERLAAEGRAARVQHHLAVLAAAGEADLLRGNRVRLLKDGPETFAAMKRAIARARHRILFESYIFEDDGVAAEFAALLLERARAGVKVALLYDSVGSLDSDPAFFERLAAGGVAVCAFNPVNPLKRPGRWELLQRNHRKVLVADSDAAYTGGINISNVYGRGSGGSGGAGWAGASARAAGPASPDGWRDTQVELQGPAVTALALHFRESWLGQGCRGELPPAPPPLAAAPGERIVKVMAADPAAGVNPTYTTLMKAIQAAQASVHLTMAYFAPGAEMVAALAAAARRGVDVSLVLPGTSDVKLVLHAARSHYARLLEAGVTLHEMPGTVMHAKTAVIDGVLSSVGSSNLDWRSILVNNEIDVIVLGDDFGRQMEALFADDVAASRLIDPHAWRGRGLGQRLLEGIGRLLEPLL